MSEFDFRKYMSFSRQEPLRFSQWVDLFLQDPEKHLKTSATIILEAIRFFDYQIVIRSGDPVLHYKVFNDLFSNGLNAVCGQENCIKRIIDVLESVDKESGPKRGLVLVGPPASGKTNIVDLISQSLEEYAKESDLKLYSFVWKLNNGSGRELELRSSLRHNPLLLFPISLRLNNGEVLRPREELFQYLQNKSPRPLKIPSFYLYAQPDKRTLDILEALLQNPRNTGKSISDLLEEYVRVEEISYSNAQGKGIANIDDMAELHSFIRPFTLAAEDVSLLNQHLQGKFMFKYEGPLLSSNRGLLHIHDAFGLQNSGQPNEHDYKPLLMLLGSGRVSLESTQATLDNTVILTTNLEEMEGLEHQLTSSKLLDRIDKIPVNYLLDSVSEMDILRRDMANMYDKYDIDPNLFRIASYYSVMTRLIAPEREEFPQSWKIDKKSLYKNITPEQKLAIYSCRAEDPFKTIRSLPHWHPFRNECNRLNINIYSDEVLEKLIKNHPDAPQLENTGLFSKKQVKLIDDEFMRLLRREHEGIEGKYGLSIRQLQNIMRNTIVSSDGRKVSAVAFLTQLQKLIDEGPEVHHWLNISRPVSGPEMRLAARNVFDTPIKENAGGYGDYTGLVKVTIALYHGMIKKEITIAIVDRDPARIEADLRRYLQHALLYKARENKAFSHILIPQYTYIDSISGKKVEHPDESYLQSIEKILTTSDRRQSFRRDIAQNFLDFVAHGEIKTRDGHPLIYSKNDNLTSSFAREYQLLLSHRRPIKGVNPEKLEEAFFQKLNAPEYYSHNSENIRELTERILSNLTSRFHYSEGIALDVITYALRHNIVDFKEIIT